MSEKVRSKKPHPQDLHFQRKITLRDIAKGAGVSATAMSRALNNSREVNAGTRKRVLTIV